MGPRGGFPYGTASGEDRNRELEGRGLERGEKEEWKRTAKEEERER